jgi:3-dehydroquinate synthetase
MVAELHLSQKKLGLPTEEKISVTSWVQRHFPAERGFPFHDEEILAYMQHDKKNVGSQWRFSLLRHIGEGAWGISCSEEEVRDALHYLRETWRTSIS